MKKLRLLFPQWQGGTGPDYQLGARLLAFLAPKDEEAPIYEVPVDPWGSYELKPEKGMFARSALLRQLDAAADIIDSRRPDQIVTFGGDCLVDQAPISYLNKRYDGDLGVIWTDAHPDISNTEIFPNGNSMVVGSLMGAGDREFAEKVEKKLKSSQFLYCGMLPSTAPAEQALIDRSGIAWAKPEELFETSEKVINWIRKNKFRHVHVHLDVDVLDPAVFHSTVFGRPEEATDCSKGKMNFRQLGRLFHDVSRESEMVGFTITEHLPWDMMDLKAFLEDFPIFQE